jgi:hypothetical protein
MRILPPFEEKIRHSIRDELAKKPTITMTALKEQLEKEYGRDFHFSYLRKLVGKVRNEISYEIDRSQIEPRLAFYRMMREELMKIVYWKPARSGKPLARDRVEAAKAVVILDLAILNAEAAAGMYKKPIELLAKEIRYDPLPPEVRVAVIAAWSRGGLLPRAAIEQMVPTLADSSR